MALISCRECGAEVSSSAKICPQCGAKPKFTVGCFGQLFFLAVGLIFLSQVLPGSILQRGEPTDWRLEDNSILAEIRLQRFVKENLKAPSTAKFPGTFDGYPIISKSGTRYTITSYVDSQNSFGAVLRTHYTATMEQTGPRTFKVVSIDFK